MPIERWHPIAELDNMRKEMERLWEEFFPAGRRLTPLRFTKEEGAATALDMIDKGEEILVRVEMPGVAKEDIDVSVVENTLTVRGVIKEEKEYKDEEFMRRERNYRSFSRAVHIPVKVNPEKIKADLKNGLLSVRLPKAEATKHRKIKIEVS